MDIAWFCNKYKAGVKPYPGYFSVWMLMYTFQLKKGCTPFQGHESLWSLDALRIPVMAWFAFSILCILLMMYCVLTQT